MKDTARWNLQHITNESYAKSRKTCCLQRADNHFIVIKSFSKQNIMQNLGKTCCRRYCDQIVLQTKQYEYFIHHILLNHIQKSAHSNGIIIIMVQQVIRVLMRILVAYSICRKQCAGKYSTVYVKQTMKIEFKVPTMYYFTYNYEA